MIIDFDKLASQQACDDTFADYQAAVMEYQSFPNERNRAVALKKHRTWQEIFLNPPVRALMAPAT